VTSSRVRSAVWIEVFSVVVGEFGRDDWRAAAGAVVFGWSLSSKAGVLIMIDAISWLPSIWMKEH